MCHVCTSSDWDCDTDIHKSFQKSVSHKSNSEGLTMSPSDKTVNLSSLVV